MRIRHSHQLTDLTSHKAKGKSLYVIMDEADCRPGPVHVEWRARQIGTLARPGWQVQAEPSSSECPLVSHDEFVGVNGGR